MHSPGQTDVITYLESGTAFDCAPDEVTRIDTHVSTVFLARDKAWKLKRDILMPFLDFTTLEARQHFCAREIEINRRTAPEIYEGLSHITWNGNSLALDGAGTSVEVLVRMKRFPDTDRLDQVAARGELTARMMRDFTDSLVSFHDSIAEAPDWGGLKGLMRANEGNALALENCPDDIWPDRDWDALISQMKTRISRCHDLLDARRSSGKVRECHGDVHLANICLWHGQPTLFDGIEFEDDFANVDVLYDVAFLIMDLWHRGLRDLASIAFNRYMGRTGDLAGLTALPLFLSSRATIRAHVEGAAAPNQTTPALRTIKVETARTYLNEAFDYLADPAPMLIGLSGLSGSGKSTAGAALAPHLGRAPGAYLCRSDMTRKRLFGVLPETPLPPENYSPENAARVYATLFDDARTALAAGQSVIMDSVTARPEERTALEQLAQDCKVPFKGFWIEAPLATLKERVAARTHDVSDAGVAVVDKQAAYDLGEITWQKIDGSGSPAMTLKQISHALNLPMA